MKKMDLLARFKSHMGKKHKNGCIFWNDCMKNQYAGLTISVKKEGKNQYKTKTAHRLSYELFVGKIPKDKCVLHKCDNRSCVNPEHLFLGTHKDNAIDMINKNRGNMKKGEIFTHHLNFKGQDHPLSKLSDKQVVKIKVMIKNKVCSYAEIAKKFNVCSSNISLIARGKTWAHINV